MVSRTDLRCRDSKPRTFDITANIVGVFSHKEMRMYRVYFYVFVKSTLKLRL